MTDWLDNDEELVACPFCKEEGFNLPVLKEHLTLRGIWGEPQCENFYWCGITFHVSGDNDEVAV